MILDDEKIPFFNERLSKKGFQKITKITLDAMKEVAIKSILAGKTQSETIESTVDVGISLSKAVLILSKESCK